MILEYGLQGSFCFWHTDAYKYSTSGWICATSTTCISLVIVSSYQIFDYKSLRTLIWKTTDLLPPNIIKHETNTFSQHIEIKYLSWEKYNISNLRTCHIASQNDHERATIRIFFFQHHVIIFKQFCVVFFTFRCIV